MAYIRGFTVMAGRLMVPIPSHYLNQCWIRIGEGCGTDCRAISQEITRSLIWVWKLSIKDYSCNFKGQWVNAIKYTMAKTGRGTKNPFDSLSEVGSYSQSFNTYCKVRWIMRAQNLIIVCTPHSPWQHWPNLRELAKKHDEHHLRKRKNYH